MRKSKIIREWDTSTPGRPPALRSLKPTEDELKAALASPGASMMSADDKMLAHAAASVETYEANLKFFMGDYIGDDKQDKILFYRHALAGALGDMGRFDEALSVLTSAKGSAHPNCSKAVAHIKKVKVAVDLDDDYMCNCERPKAELPALTSRGTQTKTVALNRRHSVGKVYSAKHRKVVDLLRCSRCGLLNATDKIPERQVQIEELRAEQEAAQRAMLQNGIPLEKITARMWAGKNGPGFHAEHSDNVLLADTDTPE